MSQMRRTLMKLKNDGLIQSWNEHSNNCATVVVKLGNELIIAISDEYYLITLSDVIKAYSDNNSLRYVVKNYDQSITAEAEAYCQRNKIEVIAYTNFRYILHKIHEG